MVPGARPVHFSHVRHRIGVILRRVQATVAGIGSHQSLLHMVEGREHSKCVLSMSYMLDDNTLSCAWISDIVP
jgi:hypothetical protein